MRVRVMAALVAAFALAPAVAEGRDFAPLDRPGPAIGARAALSCTDDVADAKVEPVLLNPATGVTVFQNYDWNYMRAFKALGIPYCAYDAPQHTIGDIQTSGELLVDAIRTMHAMAGRRIAILGHSQGGMSFRWALRFWPDTRAMVDDTIALAGSNHGTTVAPDCSPGCPPATWQQADEARFIQAVNSGAETFPGISYTNVHSNTDEVVRPPESTNLATGGGRITNVATQDLCPGDLQEHLFVGTVDPVAYALAIDALTHDGPADPARIDRAVCLQTQQPGIDPANPRNYTAFTEAGPYLQATATPGVNFTEVPGVKAEPELRCYVFADCADTQQTARGATTCASKRRFAVRVPRGVRHVRVTLAGKRLKVRHRKVVVDLRGRAKGTVKLRITGRKHGRRFVQVRRYHPCTRR